MQKNKSMKKEIIRLFSLAVLSLGIFSSCSQDRDVQESIVSTTQVDQNEGELQSVELSFDGKFSLAPIDLQNADAMDREDDLRSLEFKLEQSGSTLKDGRKLKYKYTDGEELDAMLILRCKGDNTMPYFYNMIKLVYHSNQGKFTAKDSHLHFHWNGNALDTNEVWELRVVLTRQMSSLVPTSGTKPTSLKVPLGDKTSDGVDDNDPVDNTTPVYNLTDYDLSNNFLDIDQVCKDSAVPFYSDWEEVQFTQQTGGGNQPQYSLGITTPEVKLKPKGVFVLLDLSTANELPMDLTARGLQVQTSAYAFSGELDFSKEKLEENDGEPEWVSGNDFLDYQPEANLSQYPIYTKHFRFVDTAGNPKTVSLPKSLSANNHHYYLFWVMPLKVDDNCFTQMYLKTELTNPSEEATASATDNTKFVRTNRNILKLDKGKVAAVFDGDGRGISPVSILQGENDYLEHGIVANSLVSRQIPSVRNYPLYSNTKPSVYSTDDETVYSRGKAGDIKQGVILYAETKPIKRSITFLEYMSETPCVNGKTGTGTHTENNGVFCAKNPLPHLPFPSPDGDEFHFTFEAARDKARDNTLGYQTKLPEAIELGTYFRQEVSAGIAGEVPNASPIPVPLKNNNDNEHWYYIEFALFDGLVIQDMGGNNPLKSKVRVKGEASQLWKMIPQNPANPLADFELVNKSNRYMVYLNGNFRARPISDMTDHKAHLSLTKVTHNGGQWVLKAAGDGNTQSTVSQATPAGNSMNALYGLTDGRDLATYGDSDTGNALSFIAQERDEEGYVYFKFRNSRLHTIQDMGAGQAILVKNRTYDTDAQMWKVVPQNPADPYADFELVNKATGNYIIFADGKFKTRAGADMTANPSHLSLWTQPNGLKVLKAQSMASNKALNAYQGIVVDHYLAAWNDTDSNSPIEFSMPATDPNALQVSVLGGEGPYNLSQNFKSRLPFEAEAKERPTYVFRSSEPNVYYAVRYMDHEDGITCTDASRPSALHEGGDWHNCNKRRCLVRYETDMASMTSVTMRYVGQNDALANKHNPIWAEEAFWQRNQADDVVRYYTRFYGCYSGVAGSYNYSSTLIGSYWTSQDALSGAPENSKEVILLDAPMAPTNYSTAYHNYGVNTTDLATESHLPLYLFMEIQDWGQ